MSDREKQIEEAAIRIGYRYGNNWSDPERGAFIMGANWADANESPTKPVEVSQDVTEDSYAVQLKWQRSTIHDVCGFLKRSMGDDAEIPIGLIRNYYNLDTPKERECPPHSWNQDGERCTKCGDKDWMT